MKRINRKTNIVIALSFLLAGLAAIGGRAAVPKANNYALTAQVVEIDRLNDVVTVEDYNGFLWQFSGVEDWQINDCVSLVMTDNGTEKIYNDAIKSVRYDGWSLIGREIETL